MAGRWRLHGLLPRPLVPGPTGWLLLTALAMVLPLAMPARVPVLPAWLLALSLLGVALGRRGSKLFLLAASALWTALAAEAVLRDRLPPAGAGEEVVVTGTVLDLPLRRGERLEFLFLAEPQPGVSEVSPRRIRARWYQDAADVRAGERWIFRLRWQPPRGRVNFHGRDDERGWFAAGVGALATVRSGLRLEAAPPGPGPMREWLRRWITQRLGEEPAVGVLLALAIADRSGLDEDTQGVLTATGTGHLLAISGLHVGLAAALGYYLAWVSRWLLPAGLRLRWGMQLAWWPALFAALCYAMLAGLGVSTRRALIMLGVGASAGLSGRRLPALHAWSVALVAVLACAPLSVLTPGFSLSFTAVAVLLAAFSPRVGRLPAACRLLQAQLAIMLVMLPLGMFWFERATGLGLAANLLAIPVVSLGLVPLVLGGLAFLALGAPALAHGLLLPAAWIADGLVRSLRGMAASLPWSGLETQAPDLPVTLAAAAAGLLALTPARLALRLPAALLMLALLARPQAGADVTGLRLDLLDVGQGLAAIVRYRDQTLLYDSGPGRPGHWDMAGAVILPALRGLGRTPERLLVSHGDLDHAGGLDALTGRFPHMRVAVNKRRADGRYPACTDRLRWEEGDARFEILHPSPFLPYMGNLSSCVLAVRTGAGSVLLPGDIDTVVERRLVDAGLPAFDVLVVPHHGSATSSSTRFIEAVQPALALVPAGVDNRFGFPKPEVVQRYRERSIRVASVSDCGALSVELQPGLEPQIRSARTARRALWRWPAAADCP